MSQTSVLTPPDLQRGESATTKSSQYWLYVLFFLSGFPALIYQIVWQRALFIVYGVNVESVTVVVTAFMLGLGLGSLVGGRISRSRWPLIPVFAAVELCTSLYGIVSLHLFHRMAEVTAGASVLFTGVCAFSLVVIPTILMGSTLPILLAYLVKVVPNMGRATGLLYFVNTLGSATACFVAGLFTMRLLGMYGSVRLAAAINALVGAGALAAWIATRSRLGAAELWGPGNQPASVRRVLPFTSGLALAAFSGFIALGYEIVWYRLFSWASATNPKTFACLLGSYLAGLALGSYWAQRRCGLVRSETGDLRFTGAMLVAGNLLAVGLSLVFSVVPHNHMQTIGMVWVACAATLLGTTFPMVCHLTVRPDDSAGEGLSFLYLSNIIGSAAGSFVTGYILTEVLPLSAITALLATAGVVLGFILMRRSGVGNSSSEAAPWVRALSPTAGLVVAAFCGFIVFAYAMWWNLAFSEAYNTSGNVFALLASCLAGLGLGALGMELRRRSGRPATNHLWFMGTILVGGSLMAMLLPLILSIAAHHHPKMIGLVWVACAATLLGSTFPKARVLAPDLDVVTESRFAKKWQDSLHFSYLAGVLAGSFVTGYVLAQMFSVSVIGALLATSGILVGFSLMLCSGADSRLHAVVNGLAGISLIAVLVYSPPRSYETLCSGENLCAGTPFSRLVENRHGVVAVENDGNTVVGGGAYDGKFNVDPVHDDNGVRRCYSLFGFLSRPPKRVLMIGLSSGSWAQVVANHPDVESLTIVEINPGYLQLIPEHPQIASLLRNPKVSIVIDDGHRWLLRNPEAKFDLLVMNTTFFWRANSTNLLSREFLELVRRHLEPGGAHFYNTTGSPEAQFTAVSVFPYAVRISNFIAVSDAPLRFHSDRWQGLMRDYRIDGTSLLDLSRANDRVFLDAVSHDAQLVSSAPNIARTRNSYFELEASLRSRWSARTVVTDDNMAVEWRGREP